MRITESQLRRIVKRMINEVGPRGPNPIEQENAIDEVLGDYFPSMNIEEIQQSSLDALKRAFPSPESCLAALKKQAPQKVADMQEIVDMTWGAEF